MEIANTIGWRTPWLRKMVRFCCRELEYPSGRITKATFRMAGSADYSGSAQLEAHAIRVKINPLNVYPLAARRHRGLPDLMQADAVEVLVRITAHEIAHLERWDRFLRERRQIGKRDGTRERATERLARRVLAVFRQDRTQLLAAWGEPGPGPVCRSGVIHRHTCRRCGQTWNSVRRSRDAERRSCPKCFPSWEAASAAGEFLIYERIREATPTEGSVQDRPSEARRAQKGRCRRNDRTRGQGNWEEES